MKSEADSLYRKQVALIALNDDLFGTESLNVERVAEKLSVYICAWTFDKDPRQVAKDVVRVRKGDALLMRCPCVLCGKEHDIFFTTPSGRQICDECVETLCHLCQEREGEHELLDRLICSVCQEEIRGGNDRGDSDRKGL